MANRKECVEPRLAHIREISLAAPSGNRMDAFATTRWTLVLKAAAEDPAYDRPALGELMARYWQALYGYARFKGLSASDAEDATQEFLSQLLDRGFLEKADPLKGRFRSFLLTAWKRFLIDRHRYETREQRGGQIKHRPIAIDSAEQHWLTSRILYSTDPDRAFMLDWVNGIMEQTRLRMQQDYSSGGREVFFKTMFPLLSNSLDENDYQSLAKELKTTSNAIKVGLHRLRQRFAQKLREVVAETVEEPEETESEIRELSRYLALGKDTIDFSDNL